MSSKHFKTEKQCWHSFNLLKNKTVEEELFSILNLNKTDSECCRLHIFFFAFFLFLIILIWNMYYLLPSLVKYKGNYFSHSVFRNLSKGGGLKRVTTLSIGGGGKVTAASHAHWLQLNCESREILFLRQFANFDVSHKPTLC